VPEHGLLSNSFVRQQMRRCSTRHLWRARASIEQHQRAQLRARLRRDWRQPLILGRCVALCPDESIPISEGRKQDWTQHEWGGGEEERHSDGGRGRGRQGEGDATRKGRRGGVYLVHA
jgi:hypothetical protein